MNDYKSSLKKLVVFIFIFIFAFSVNAEIRLPSLLVNGLVLQRETDFQIKGWANPGEKVTLNFDGKTYRAKTDKQGNWSFDLPPQQAGGPFEMVFKGENEITIQDVLFGDVWFCSGQSNMVLPMERVKEKYGEEIQNANYSEIRHFFIPTTTNLVASQKDLPEGTWKEANPEDVMTFSATAYFFAKKIYSKYKIPIGLINASVGGTPIEAWISEAGFSEFPELQKTIEKNKDTVYVNSFKNRKKQPQPKPADKGLLETPKWFETSYKPKGWYTINIPGYWEDQGVRDLNGVVWYRKEIEVPETMTGVPAKLFMGRIIDADEVYVNGTKIGNITYQYPPRRYTIPNDLLQPGKNTIVIRVSNYGGKGGFVPDKPYFLEAGNQQIDLKGTWVYKVGEVFESNENTGSGFSAQNQPASLFNAMVAPVLNQKIKGILWYQGESNSGRPETYNALLKTLISDWREKWDNPDLPFCYVQLANFMETDYLPVESKWAELRFAQFQALSVPQTAMAVAIDLGEWNDIHPLNKKDVGERLALGAMKLAYKEDIVYSGPIYQSAKKAGNKFLLSFSSAGSGLTSNDGEELRRFEIAGADGKFKWAKAKIVGDNVEVWCPEIENPVQVRYAWADNPRDANFYNKDGLPASPFQTEKMDK